MDAPVFRVHISGKAEVGEEDPVMLTVVLTNESAAPLSLLKWGTPLESAMTRDIFDVVHNGRRLPYVGRRVKRGAPQEADYLTVSPGQSVQGSVSLREGYRLDEVGKYSVRLRPDSLHFRNHESVQINAESFVFTVKK